MTAPLDVTGDVAGSDSSAILSGLEAKAIEGRSLGQIAWMRFKRDKIALISLGVIILLILFTVLAPLINKLVGVDPFTDNINALDINSGTGQPLGHFGGISGAHPFGVEPTNGRDLLARIDVGARYSLMLSGVTLRKMFAVFLVLIAIRMWFSQPKGAKTASAQPAPEAAPR